MVHVYFIAEASHKPTAVSGSGLARKQSGSFDAVIHTNMQEATHTAVPKSASQAVFVRLQLTLHATRRTSHGIRAWCIVSDDSSGANTVIVAPVLQKRSLIVGQAPPYTKKKPNS